MHRKFGDVCMGMTVAAPFRNPPTPASPLAGKGSFSGVSFAVPIDSIKVWGGGRACMHACACVRAHAHVVHGVSCAVPVDSIKLWRGGACGFACMPARMQCGGARVPARMHPCAGPVCV